LRNKNTIIETTKQTIDFESKAIANLNKLLNVEFENAVKFIQNFKERVSIALIVTMGNNYITQLLVEKNDKYEGIMHMQNILKEGIF